MLSGGIRRSMRLKLVMSSIQRRCVLLLTMDRLALWKDCPHFGHGSQFCTNFGNESCEEYQCIYHSGSTAQLPLSAPCSKLMSSKSPSIRVIHIEKKINARCSLPQSLIAPQTNTVEADELVLHRSPRCTTVDTTVSKTLGLDT